MRQMGVQAKRERGANCQNLRVQKGKRGHLGTICGRSMFNWRARDLQKDQGPCQTIGTRCQSTGHSTV